MREVQRICGISEEVKVVGRIGEVESGDESAGG